MNAHVAIRREKHVPLSGLRYSVGLCAGSKTLTIAKLLYADHDVQCWVPRLKRKNPTKKQAHTIAALPGFIFIAEDQWDMAHDAQTKKLVPGFSPLLVNDHHAVVAHQELIELSECVTTINIDAEEIGSMRVGDDVRVVKGPLSGGIAVLLEIYIDLIQMARIEMRNGARQVFSVPLLLIRSV